MAKNKSLDLKAKLKLSDGKELPHPTTIADPLWEDNMKIWPLTEAPHILYYLVKNKACDFHETNCFKSMESYNYLESGWVGTVYAFQVAKDIIFLKCKVTPSQALTDEARQAWACVNKSGQVIEGGCSCMAGQGKTCSHVGALLWKVDLANKKGLVGMACTDTLAKWNSGSKQNIEPILVKNIKFKKPRLGDEVSLHLSTSNLNGNTFQIDQYDSHKHMIEQLEQAGFGKLMRIPGTILNNTISSTPTNLPTMKFVAQVKPIHDHTNADNLPGSCEFCTEFYDKFINISDSKITELQNETLNQANSKSQLWVESRRLRLTGSTANNVPKRSTTNPQKFLLNHLYKPFRGNKFTEHGKVCEKKGIEYLSNILSRDIQQAGTFISEDNPWLSTSPDGLIDDDAIVEIKCPYPDGKEFNLKSVDLIKNNEEDLFLKPKGERGYYTQVQLEMYCTRRTYTYFFVYLAHDPQHSILANCKYDEQFVGELIARLRRFYFNHMLPKLATDFQTNYLVINQEYLSFVKKCSQK